MRIRYPEGFRSIVDADLSLRGTLSSLLLRGTVTVHDALYAKRFEPNVDLSRPGAVPARSGIGAASAPALPVTFDVQIDAPSALRVENNLAHMVASADLQAAAAPTIARCCSGRAQIERGDILFEGNRYLVTRGTHRLRQSGPHRAVLRHRG